MFHGDVHIVRRKCLHKLRTRHIPGEHGSVELLVVSVRELLGARRFGL